MMKNLKLFRIKDTPYTTSALNVNAALNHWFDRDIQLIEGGSSFKFGANLEDVEELTTHFNAKKEIHDDQTFSEYASELISEFSLSLSGDDRYTRPCDPENEDDVEGADFMYKSKGIAMIERMHSRLYWLGDHYWPIGDISIENSSLTEG